MTESSIPGSSRQRGRDTSISPAPAHPVAREKRAKPVEERSGLRHGPRRRRDRRGASARGELRVRPHQVREVGQRQVHLRRDVVGQRAQHRLERGLRRRRGRRGASGRAGPRRWAAPRWGRPGKSTTRRSRSARGESSDPTLSRMRATAASARLASCSTRRERERGGHPRQRRAEQLDDGQGAGDRRPAIGVEAPELGAERVRNLRIHRPEHGEQHLSQRRDAKRRRHVDVEPPSRDRRRAGPRRPVGSAPGEAAAGEREQVHPRVEGERRHRLRHHLDVAEAHVHVNALGRGGGSGSGKSVVIGRAWTT